MALINRRGFEEFDENCLKFSKNHRQDGGGICAGPNAYYYPALSGPSYGQIHLATTSLDGNGRAAVSLAAGQGDNHKRPLLATAGRPDLKRDVEPAGNGSSAVGAEAAATADSTAARQRREKFLCCCCGVLAAGLLAVSGFLLLSYLPAFRPPPSSANSPASSLPGGASCGGFGAVRGGASAASGPGQSPTSPDGGVCLGHACLKAAAEMEEALNRSIDPCGGGGGGSDFFSFACGGWLAENHMPPTVSVWSRQEKLQMATRGHLQEVLEESDEATSSTGQTSWEAKLRTFYKACANLEDPRVAQCHAASAAAAAATGEGAAGDVGGGAAEDEFQSLLKHCQRKGMRRLSDRIICIAVDQGVDTLFRLRVVASPWQSGKQVLLLDEFSEPELQEAAASSEAERASLHRLVATLVDDLGHLGDSVGRNYADSVLTVLNSLTDISLSAGNEFKSQPQLRAVKLTVAELRQQLDGSLIQFDHLVAYFLHDNQDANVDDEIIAVGNLNYFRQLSNLMKRLRDDDLKKFLEFCLIHKFASFYSSPSRRHLLAYRARRVGQELAEDSWLPCLRLLEGPGLNAAYYKEQGSKLALGLISDVMVPYLKRAFINIVTNRTDVNRHVIQKIIDKVNSMNFLIGFSLAHMTDDFLNQYYAEWTVRPTDSTLSMVVGLIGLRQRRLRQNLRTRSRTLLEETADITSVYPSYRYAENTVVLPAAFLQWPYHLADNMMPYYLKFAFIGTALASQMVKSMDSVGANWDSNGLKSDQKISVLTLENEICLRRSLTQALSSLQAVPVNAAATSILGLQVAVEAYRLQSLESGRQLSLPTVGFSPAQSLFVAFAQAHCGDERPALLAQLADTYLPLRTRVHLALQHSDQFQHLFQCPVLSNKRNCLSNLL